MTSTRLESATYKEKFSLIQKHFGPPDSLQIAYVSIMEDQSRRYGTKCVFLKALHHQLRTESAMPSS